jgi:predicted GIY-YIG superfamily endonuclease
MPYSVYIIKLERTVHTKGRFKKANPLQQAGKPCFYVGSTSKQPDERFLQHKSGIKSNRFVHEFGERRIGLSKVFENFKTRQEAEAAEEKIALRLREKGYGVWFGV